MTVHCTSIKNYEGKRHFICPNFILNYSRTGVCKYRPEVGKIKFLKNPKQIMYTPLGILVMKI